MSRRFFSPRNAPESLVDLCIGDEVKVVNNLASKNIEADDSQYHTHFSGALVGKPHVTTALDHALCFSPACRLSDFVGSLNAELEMGATCTVGDGQCA